MSNSVTVPADKLAELQREAARYRWLRDESNGAPDDTPTIYSIRKGGRIIYGPELDEEVDRARGVKGGQGG